MQDPAYAPDKHGRQIEQAITLAMLRAEDGTQLPVTRLQELLEGVAPQDLKDALARLVRRRVVSIEGNAVEAINSQERRHKLDQLAAVVLHVLVVTQRPVTVPQVARECERDHTRLKEREEVELALAWIAEDDLATRQDEGWAATRPAVRAAELSF